MIWNNPKFQACLMVWFAGWFLVDAYKGWPLMAVLMFVCFCISLFELRRLLRGKAAE